MAIGMMSVRVGRKGKALPHCQYIAKLDKFAKDSDQIVAHSYGNMPDWAKDNPALFWEMADLHERKNGSIRYSPMSRPNNHKIKIELG